MEGAVLSIELMMGAIIVTCVVPIVVVPVCSVLIFNLMENEIARGYLAGLAAIYTHGTAHWPRSSENATSMRFIVRKLQLSVFVTLSLGFGAWGFAFMNIFVHWIFQRQSNRFSLKRRSHLHTFAHE